PTEKLPQLTPGHGGVVEYHGEKAGVYKAEDGQVFAVSVKCPHMGCQLTWNPDEKSWDCPCHGSRFDYRGRLIDGPAQTAVDGEFPQKSRSG
ncbi:MAG: Rieske 2Fe-2S domain-containing protein, partial [Schaedlerella sp.]|uniref:Rieske 2Fe-2S domain-containing protein n=1 Tax=Schaedlerella sp. TaxID=2676057 RepID=UPI0035298A03